MKRKYTKSKTKSKSKNNSKSKSRSKSRDSQKSSNNRRSYSNPNNFFFHQKSILLTYAHTEKTGITKEELGNYLFDTFKCIVTVVCLEHHKDGAPHLHAWLEWDEAFYTKDARIFDFKGHHPNIGVMLDKKKNTRGNALNYMLKEDQNLT